MKVDRSLFLRIALVIVDVLAVIISFALAYYYRIHISSDPYYFVPNIRSFVLLAVTLLPVWIVINYVVGLYNRSVFLYRPKEYGLILLASIVSVMSLISYEFFTGDDVFPVRIIAVYFIIINFTLMVLARETTRFVHKFSVSSGFGRQKVLLIGNNMQVAQMADFFYTNPGYGYDVVGAVASSEFLPKSHPVRCFSTFREAIKRAEPEILIQTDTARSEDVYNYAIENHLSYMFIPQQSRLLSQLNSVEIIGGLPMIDVKVTKLFGAGRVWKRLMDLTLGWFGLIIASPIMAVIIVIMKITEPGGKIFFRQVRLTRFNREFQIYKFRSVKAKYNGLTPEQAFQKMGKPELAKTYRKNGDKLDNDPRITRLGKILRATSLDELPQLINVIRGDISLVGPRALIPQEINQYKKKDIILAVKSGVTGLAQVSGRRNISFEERRRLDVYYVQNWSLLLDIQILFKTVLSVILRRGAK